MTELETTRYLKCQVIHIGTIIEGGGLMTYISAETGTDNAKKLKSNLLYKPCVIMLEDDFNQLKGGQRYEHAAKTH